MERILSLLALLLAIWPWAEGIIHIRRVSEEVWRQRQLMKASHGGLTNTSRNCAVLTDYEVNKQIVDGYLDGTFPVVLFGWTMCSCTDIAQQRFAHHGLCVEQRLWTTPGDSLLAYLQCIMDDPVSHSFIFFWDSVSKSMVFKGNGFGFDEDATSDTVLHKLITNSGARTDCGTEAIEHVNVYGSPLQECRVANDQRGSWQDDGTCTEAVGNVHQICLQSIPADFSTKTGQSAWSESRDGARHCVCIGAWSLYMTLEEANPVVPHCHAVPSSALSATYIANWKIWYVSRRTYPADVKVGIVKLVEKCLSSEQGELTHAEKCGLKSRFLTLQQREPLLEDASVAGLSSLTC